MTQLQKRFKKGDNVRWYIPQYERYEKGVIIDEGKEYNTDEVAYWVQTDDGQLCIMKDKELQKQ
ncbi:MAG TPA: hypothetical protein VJB87_02840 [Candidatus Nanoarchaeia archaeon]|nr:hypothetical protein [Candidatus Nanoarchaeia archaeon]